MGTYVTGCFCAIIDIYINLITCKDKVVIMLILQSYILYLYYIYLLHPGIHRIEAMTHQNLYWPRIINSVRKEVNNIDICQCTKRSKKHMENYQLRKLRKYHGTNSVKI